MNALVVGAGGFGKHYARIMSQLDPGVHHHIPRIDKLIVSRTRYEQAKLQAEAIQKDERCRVAEIQPVQVSSSEHLRLVLKEYTPSFIGIAARDRVCGDAIHAAYTQEALAYGAVLCEKPFCPAHGDGSSLKYLEVLSAHERADLFGMDLPFAVVMQEILRKEDLRMRLIHAEKIDFFWETRVAPENYIINDLALHPWSLIPENFQVASTRVETSGNNAFIQLQMRNVLSGSLCECRITLKDGGSFRGMMVDGYPIGIFSDGPAIRLVELGQSIYTAAESATDPLRKKILLRVDNPLKQQIVSVLCRSPIVGLPRVHASQLFLERLHGFNA
jgi:hypothetical protein